VLFDEIDGFEPVLALSYDVNVAGIFQKISEFISGKLFIVDDHRG